MNDTFVAEANRQELERGGNKQSAAQRNSSGRVTSREPDPRRDFQSMTPRVDVVEDAAGITVLADLPGVSKDSLEIKVENDAC